MSDHASACPALSPAPVAPANHPSQIIRGEIPCFKIFETDHALAFLDAFPVCKGHSLLIPKALGYKTIADMPADVSVVSGVVKPQDLFHGHGLTVCYSDGDSDGALAIAPSATAPAGGRQLHARAAAPVQSCAGSHGRNGNQRDAEQRLGCGPARPPPPLPRRPGASTCMLSLRCCPRHVPASAQTDAAIAVDCATIRLCLAVCLPLAARYCSGQRATSCSSTRSQPRK